MKYAPIKEAWDKNLAMREKGRRLYLKAGSLLADGPKSYLEAVKLKYGDGAVVDWATGKLKKKRMVVSEFIYSIVGFADCRRHSNYCWCDSTNM